MKKLIFPLIFCFLVAQLFVSCKKDDATNSQASSDMGRGQLLGVMNSASYSCNEFADAINGSPVFSYFKDEMGADNVIANLIAPGIKTLVNGRKPILDLMFAKRVGCGSKWQIETYTFAYNSVDAYGRPITLAGRVTFPNNTVEGTIHEVSSLSIFSHQYIEAQDWAPSSNLTLMSMRCLYNSAVIEPDFQGYGYDNMKHVHTILSTETMGRQVADCAMAAVELMKLHGVQLASDGIVTNWGTSAGEPYTLAFARYYDREATSAERAALPLKSTFANDGILDFAALTQYQDEHPDLEIFYSDYMSALTSMPPSALHGYKAEDFFPEWMNTTMIKANGQTANYLYWLSRFADYSILVPNMPDPSTIPPCLGIYFSSDMLKKDGHLDYDSPKTQAFLQICRENMTYDDWVPQTDIYLANEDEDLISPYDLDYAVFQKLRQRSDRVHWLVIDNSLSPLRPYLDVHYVSSNEALLYMTLAPEPKDMCLIHREKK